MTAMDTIVAAYDLADEEGVGPADPLRLLPLAASQAVRDDLVVSVEDWFQAHDGDRVATLRLGGVTRVIASRYPICRMEAHERYARFSCMEAPVLLTIISRCWTGWRRRTAVCSSCTTR